ncbi:MAG: DUF664 domain-containing protein [Acidimicrobiales bacterium]
MGPGELFRDAFGRIRDEVHRVLDGVGTQALTFRADTEANSISWLVWHLTRVQDDHVAEVAGIEQVWVAGGWADRFNLGLDVRDIGYGHSADQVGLVTAGAELLAGYHDAVFEQTVEYVTGLSDDELDRVVDRRFDPPVTLGVRLVSVVGDDLQHVGQAALLRGIVDRAS